AVPPPEAPLHPGAAGLLPPAVRPAAGDARDPRQRSGPAGPAARLRIRAALRAGPGGVRAVAAAAAAGERAGRRRLPPQRSGARRAPGRGHRTDEGSEGMTTTDAIAEQAPPRDEREVVLEARGVTKHFEVRGKQGTSVVRAVEDIDLQLHRGEI